MADRVQPVLDIVFPPRLDRDNALKNRLARWLLDIKLQAPDNGECIRGEPCTGGVELAGKGMPPNAWLL